jgi:hypothetical protein
LTRGYFLPQLQEREMKTYRTRVLRLACCVTALIFWSIESFALAVPFRGSSRNGVTEQSSNWNIFGPVASTPRHGGDVSLRTQVVCANRDFVNAVNPEDFENSGTCQSGNYLFIFQIQSSVNKLEVVIRNLVGFTPDETEGLASYGLLVCEDSNTAQLCSDTTHASADAVAKLDNISVTVNNKTTAIKFHIPKFPLLPAGGAPRQGQGLTFVVLTAQPLGQPVVVPKISFSF